MNIIMVEATDIPEAKIDDEVVLIGRSGDEFISAEQFAQWAGTINYEVTTRVNDRIPRIMVE
jgi:alanine racemase